MAIDILTLAGEPLLIEDVDCDLRNWMEVFQNLDDLREFGALPVPLVGERKGSRSSVRGGAGLPLPNYAEKHPPRLNTLYWPTGAARWAYGFFLATGKAKKRIVSQAHYSAGAVSITLKMDSLSTEVYLLPPRPISDRYVGTEAGVEEELWLMPVVDFRFWFQFYNSGDIEVEPDTTWAELFAAVLPTSTITVDAIDAAYLNPDPAELTRRFDSVGVLLDAMAHSVGQRIVRATDGTLRSINSTNSGTKLTTNITSVRGTLAAGQSFSDSNGDVPAKVTVAFPKYSWYVPWCSGVEYSYDISAPATMVGTKTNAKKPIHSTCFADFTGGGTTPDNDTVLQALANKIAADYYSWFGQRYDMTFNGIFLWDPCGFDDCVEWTLGRQHENGVHLAHTRIQTVPSDFGVESQLSQHPDLVVLDHFQIGRVSTANNPQYGLKYAEVEIYNHTAGSEAPKDDPSITIRAYPWPAGTPLPEDVDVWVMWHCEKNAWYALFPSTGSEPVRFRLLENKAFDVSARATRLDRDKNPIGDEIKVIDTIGHWHGLTGYEGWAFHMRDNPDPLEYEIWFLEAPPRFIEFQLDDYNGDGWAFDSGVSPNALVLRSGEAYWGLSPNGVKLTNERITIYDELLLFPRALKNAKGIAVYDERIPDPADPSRGSYRAIICNQMALMCEFILNEKMCSGDATGKTDPPAYGSVRPMTFAPFGQTPTIPGDIVYNRLGLAGKAGDPGVVVWNESRTRWEVLQMKHFEYEVLLKPTPGEEPESPGDPGECVTPSFQSLKTALMRCEDPEDVTLYEVEEKEVVTTFTTSFTGCTPAAGSASGSSPSTPGTCKIQAGLTKICVLKRSAGVADVPRYIDVASMSAVEVVTDVYDDGTCIKETLSWVFVLCSCDSHTENVFCTEVCASGSGS